MAFSLDNHWVWDFWVADPGDSFHLFYLHAPKSLGDPELRHRNARIGHATSTDLIEWTDHGEVLAPGPAGSFDATATWTGSVVRGDDGLWRMFYTGAVFPSATGMANVESIGVATSTDLHTWTKQEFVLRADEAHYEKLGDSAWPEEAWRDPWVFQDQRDGSWHMLITARAKGSGVAGGGVIGYAQSTDLERWTVRPPLSPPSAVFPHLEVLQVVDVGGKSVVVFCGARTADENRTSDAPAEGVWAVEAPGFPAAVRVDDARLIAPAPYYAGRIVHDRSGAPVLLAFIGSPGSDTLLGIADPIPMAGVWP
ncbi:glycoside hydrolase family 68 protein [Microbacterium sulfonylureivorans]|uniref:glycoside hydrolase family 68 protein n=1 Tax=Microbacterium sulfonylureivorans TaxID=2486854 RepID=UPI000FD6E9F5|nr:glycoside hydrolase family 68 protein [Microbacterium sulfonylureivorans]